MRLLCLLLLPAITLAQPDTIITFHTVEEHAINWKSKDSTRHWHVDTIKLYKPFQIKLTNGDKRNPGFILNEQGQITTIIGGKIEIDRYGTFKVDSISVPDESPQHHYWRYYLPKGVIFSWIEKFAYLTYPILNKKSFILAFYVD